MQKPSYVMFLLVRAQGEIDMRIINDLSAVIHAFMPIGSTNAVKLVEFLCKGQCHAVHLFCK